MDDDKNNSTFNILKKMRKSWPESLNPVTKVIPNKKKDAKRLRRQKEKDEEEYEER